LNLNRVKEINSVEDAETLLWELIPNPLEQTIDALKLAKKAHDGQFRKSGEPYIVHPILVAAITASFSNDETMVQAALLHDVVEDTTYELSHIQKEFGDDVALLVEGLTKIIEIRDEKLSSTGSNVKLIGSALTFRKMLIASIEDIRILVIKLCDRLHNMLTLDALKEEKKKRIAEETLVVYVPIAHRLGISRMKNSLEDLSFLYIYPNEYKEIDDYLDKNSQTLQIKLNSFIQKVKTLIVQEGFDEDEFEIFGRVKHYYSIYLKMQRKGVGIEEILDLLAVRIIVKEDTECYRVLGVMHLKFTPLVSRFKDYVAVPKENGYKTIHTTLFNDESIVEAQIRTQEMHKLAEYGIAAHWKYKGNRDEVNLEWVKSLHYHNDSVEEFYELAKCDLFSEDITVYSPDGDYYTFPKGSTTLDFAYAIHSEVGKYSIDALVNKKRASLLTVLNNGDIVNIIKDDKIHLHCSWIDTVKTSKAQHEIKSMCRARTKESDTISAYNILATLLSQKNSTIEKLVEAIGLKESIHKLPMQLDYYKETINKGANYLGAKEVRFWELLKKGYKRPFAKQLDHFNFFLNKPIDNVIFDYCCHPKVGDQIVAFHSEGKAIIHHKLCKKAYAKILANEEMIHVSWSSTKMYKYRLIISLQNQKGILADLLAKISQLNLNVTSIDLGINASDSAEYCKIEIDSDEANRKVLSKKISKKLKLVEITSLDDAFNK
jgi:RelA/SpoT family (p)ppGpp synthetase